MDLVGVRGSIELNDVPMVLQICRVCQIIIVVAIKDVVYRKVCVICIPEGPYGFVLRGNRIKQSR